MKHIIWLCLLLSACGKDIPHDDPVWDEVFTVHMNSFIAEGESHGQDIKARMVNLTVYFGDTHSSSATAVGTCVRTIHNSYSILQVTIDKEFYNSVDSDTQEELIFHELGHCVLGRKHTSETCPFNGHIIPKSIMYPYVIYGNQYREAKEEYHNELFN